MNIRLALMACLAPLLAGCVTVQPWQHQTLALPDMQPTPNPLEAGIRDHIYFSKEASSGGRGFGGGGCGCN